MNQMKKIRSVMMTILQLLVGIGSIFVVIQGIARHYSLTVIVVFAFLAVSGIVFGIQALISWANNTEK